MRTLAPSRWLAWAGQQPGLVSGTIAQNIRLGEPPASAADADPDTESTSERVRRALALAQAPDLDADQELGVQGLACPADKRSASPSPARSTAI